MASDSCSASGPRRWRRSPCGRCRTSGATCCCRSRSCSGYLFAVVGARSHRSILRLGGLGSDEDRAEGREAREARETREGRRRRRTEREREPARPLGMLVDTSAIIDGRIGDLISTGFVDRELVIPVFVLQELQRVADSTDPQRRARGRRGLEVVHDLRLSSHPVATPEVAVPDVTDVDAKLVRVAHDSTCRS